MSPTTRVIVAITTTTAAASVASYALPDEYAATGVGIVFLAAVYALVLRSNDAFIRSHGLALGGLLERKAINLPELLRSASHALAWTCVTAAVVFPLFSIGFAIWWHPSRPFAYTPPESYFDETLGQLLVVALPEEAFYRGFMQSTLDRMWKENPNGRRHFISVLGGQIGWSTPITSATFAISHLVTDPHPHRLAVFFPSLLFCWLRSRTGGIGAAVAMHAASNLLAATLGRCYGLF